MSNKKDEPVEIVTKDDILFRDQYNETYLALGGSGNEVLKINSKACRLHIIKRVRTLTGKAPSQTAVNKYVNELEADAYFDGERHRLEVRTCWHDSNLWYDLGGAACCITKNGWEQVDKPPILFRRFGHQKPQCELVKGGNSKLLFNYINIQDEDEQLLFFVTVAASFIPGFSHPSLILHGAQGSGKSTPNVAMKELIDPSELRLGFSVPRDVFEFAQTANHHLFLFYDNLTTMPLWFSDALSRAITGSSFSKRQLYTDDDDIIYSFQRIVALNGINQVVIKSDLLDRSILLHLERIPTNKRKEESVFWREFDEDKPLILGAIFDVLAKALQIYPTLDLPKLPRLADFARYGYAIAEAAGFGGDKFLQAYFKNIDGMHDAAIEANPLAQVVVEFMKDKSKWTGTAAKLLGLLTGIAVNMNLNQSKDWPKDAASFGKELNLIATNLQFKGIHFERSRKNERLLTFTKTTDGTDGNDSK